MPIANMPEMKDRRYILNNLAGLGLTSGKRLFRQTMKQHCQSVEVDNVE